MIETQPSYTAPVIPSKWDVIPVHNSDRTNFKRCRRYWNWNSPARTNLILRADVHGVNIPLWFGTGIHYALELYYTPGLRRDPAEAWKTWFDIQWRGGVVTEEWLSRVYDLKPRPVAPTYASVGDMSFGTEDMPTDVPTWQVRGLEDIIPDPDHEQFDELFVLGTEMMIFYKAYAEKNDDFEVVVAEHDFSIPVWDYKNDRILKLVDTREDSPNYGKELEVHARGRIDAIIQRHSSNLLGLLDHKTAAKIEERLDEMLQTDEQMTNYLYAAEVEANYYDLPHKGKPFEEAIYNVLRKAYPKPPTELKNGMFSTDRQNESTTIDILEKWIARHMPGVPLNEKQLQYMEYLREAGDEQFIIRKPVRRNRYELQAAGERLYLESMDMLEDPRIYPNMRNDWLCLNCVFRGPCLAQNSGADYKQLIADNYVSAKDR